jgi:hypothetical protein
VTGLLADRYRVVAPLEPVGGVPRDLCVDTATDARVEAARYAAGGPVPPAFELLARRYQACRHPCLAPVLDVLVPIRGEGSPLTIEGHADGPRLGEAMHLPRPAGLLATADIADGVATLHAAGLVHGALAPEAVALDPVGRPLVVGAGSRTLQAAALGAPEPPLTTDDDVRAIGRLLYAIVCGRPADPVPLAPATVVPGLDPALNGLILALLSDDPLRPPPPAAAVALRLRDLAGVGTRAMLPPGPPGPPALYPAYALAGPPNRIHRRGYSDAGLITGAIALLVAGILAAYAFARLDDDADAETVTSTAVRIVPRVVTVPAEGGLTDTGFETGLTDTTLTDLTDTNGIFTVPTDELTDTGPVTLTDTVTQTDPFVIPSIITVTEPVEPVTVTVTESETQTEVTTDDFTDTEFTDTEFTDTAFSDTSDTD